MVFRKCQTRVSPASPVWTSLSFLCWSQLCCRCHFQTVHSYSGSWELGNDLYPWSHKSLIRWLLTVNPVLTAFTLTCWELISVGTTSANSWLTSTVFTKLVHFRFPTCEKCSRNIFQNVSFSCPDVNLRVVVLTTVALSSIPVSELLMWLIFSDVTDFSVQKPEVPSSVEIQGRTEIRNKIVLFWNQKSLYLNSTWWWQLFCFLKNQLNSIGMKNNKEVFDLFLWFSFPTSLTLIHISHHQVKIPAF